MRRNRVVLGLVVVLVVVAGLVAACGGVAEEPVGEKLLQERCTVCHGLAPVEKAEKTRQEWNRTVTRMVSIGAELDEDEQSALIEYLTETYGP